MTLTATYDAQLSRVRLSADSLGGALAVRFERSTNQVTWSTVRGGAAVPVESGIAALDDYEFAADVVNHYRAIPSSLTEDFESDILAITIDNGTSDAEWIRSNSDAYSGIWSLRSGTIVGDQTSDAVVTVPAGATTLDYQYRISSEDGFDFLRLFVDAAEVTPAASGEVPWTAHGTVDITGAATVTFRYAKDGFVSAGQDAAWIDQLVFGGYPVQTASLTPALSSVWLKSIARPFLNRPVTVTDWSDIERPSRNGVFTVVGRSVAVAVTDVRGGRQYELVVTTPTLADADDLDLCLASGDPVFVHVPGDPDCLVPRSMYAVVGDISIERHSAKTRRRFFRLPLTEVAAPGPDVVGATITYQGVLNAFATYEALLATEPTYADVLERISDPAEVIVP
ncbi:hypothetical protein B0I33_104505 [Prauserella shujinwangii]|uniref:Uncharacterized protein n=1 Tax=Prauserella shujinwangii TaxID=1453103 RepID=A0A2T0LXF9_9PSEU|nr:hypothetical protein [Prauserella shujinwangii]PRX48687.1 hypothetical protein B0I33_104505 [Prauserella shujinwangii]